MEIARASGVKKASRSPAAPYGGYEIRRDESGGGNLGNPPKLTCVFLNPMSESDFHLSVLNTTLLTESNWQISQNKGLERFEND
ncbi:MAG: hypothetical protein A3F82_00005 [Deltaproteobacteria bacterium RIFCSPLOWO2_12_FULL_44_12]|nr:MAG: hypothetical protein A2712_09140 [Deltaproteobacteria bacterium RIFCSPHIGHO2_01_FULL_43_49]OGQ14449.1 MAG: hypothetical protein A3D22_09565 [Deltaproteobacteria bacterium RIFCSPHIGHO2_02_FULL_44_53]OGQ27830.1 MAG: hypothetical protein A3D98_03965 [Deltaproteobacteria bacterium RIFCSPHIGHO2_12_FULL_44_21]OGQ30906.1 MAG: hypothetical protein A2979_01640 [Deltaproteobacteria bacterium RIFCSPLOWO2_01_FULL_45_74]OGQ42566.1 MAG: hypothetical protein A3I70_03685 [Deltaproteobacteria bacterium 